MKKRRIIASRAEKFTRFGIRKCSLGAVSVAIATGLAFLGSGEPFSCPIRTASVRFSASSLVKIADI